MLKRLPILCAALLALAACSNNSDTGSGAAVPTTTPAQQGPAPVSAGTVADAGNVPATASSATQTVPAAGASSPAPAPAPAEPFVDNGKWVEGKDYQRIEPVQPKVTSTDKVEVVEVFSYGCPACNQFHATANKLARELPPNATMVYLPASFIPQENWPMLQRAYYAAQALGVADQGNDAMYDAVWKTHELSAMKDGGAGLKPMSALPTIEDAAKVYARFGADPKEFVAVAQSFSVDTRTRRADELVKAYGVEGTPTIVIDGKYRFSPSTVGYEQSVELAKWLVAREAAGQ
jgi:protein dithiol oxidoreductase (disulfide-forming)